MVDLDLISLLDAIIAQFGVSSCKVSERKGSVYGKLQKKGNSSLLDGARVDLFFQLKAEALQRKHLQGESGVKASEQRDWLSQLLPGWLLEWGPGTELPSWSWAWCSQGVFANIWQRTCSQSNFLEILQIGLLVLLLGFAGCICEREGMSRSAVG